MTTGFVDYDYAVLRLVPRVQLGTYQPVAVLLHARQAGFIGMRYVVPASIDWPARLSTSALRRHLRAMESICNGDASAGEIGCLSAGERFHWLTAPRSAVLQPSALHAGRTRDPEACLIDLARQYLLQGSAGRP